MGHFHNTLTADMDIHPNHTGTHTTTILGIFLLSWIIVNLSGCGGNDNSTGPGSLSPVTAPKVMFVNASPDAPPVDLYIDSTRIFRDLSYGQNTPYLTLSAGFHALIVQLLDSTRVVYAGSAPLDIGAIYTVFAADTFAHITPIIMFDLFNQPPSGFAAVRFVNAAGGTPKVGVFTVLDSSSITGKGFSEYSPFVPFKSDSTVFQIRESGTQHVLATTAKQNIESGKFYTLYLRGFAGGTGADTLTVGVIVNR